MKIDIKRAFIFPFNDSNWIINIFIGGVFCALSLLIGLLGYLLLIMLKFSGFHLSQTTVNVIDIGSYALSWIFYLFPLGFFIQSMHTLITRNEYILPEWENNYLKFFKLGVKNLLINIGYILTLLSGLLIFLGYLIWDDYLELSDFYNPYFIFQQEPAIVIFIIIAISMIIKAISPYIMASYAERFSIGDAFDLINIIRRILKGWKEFLIATFVIIIIDIIFIFLYIISVLTIIGVALLPFLIFLYNLICFNIVSQVYKNSILKD
ncbi:MAG: hypothetical protein ACD_20C00097G0027 [uncultured bacterium]|nr:MAG: hypothetical protein ACD_20C00097G0027 [uncultured bacterium]